MTREQMIEKAAGVLHGGVSSMGIHDCPMWSCRSEHRARAVDVVDALLPQVTTVEELEALPIGTVLIDSEGTDWRPSAPGKVVSFKEGLEEADHILTFFGPLTVAWSPS